MATRVGFIGLGVMGTGIVLHLLKGGFAVSFTARDNDRARANARRVKDEGATQVSSFEELARDSDLIFLCLPDTPTVEHILESPEGIGPHLRDGQIVIDMSTSHPLSTRRLAGELDERGITLLDAPLTGSKPQAETGQLNIMCAGSREHFDSAKPLFDSFCAHVFYVGGSGSGHAIKLINNYLGQVALAGLCEVYSFAKKYGIDTQSLIDVVSVSGGNSATFQGALPRFERGDFDVMFQQKLVRKDIGYMVDLLHETETPAPIAQRLLSLHEFALARGYGEQDFTALLKAFEELPADLPPDNALS